LDVHIEHELRMLMRPGDSTDDPRQRAIHLLGSLDRNQPWRRYAACKEASPRWWFPNQGEPVTYAKRICAACAVQSECLAYALDAGDLLHGVWGGTSRQERNRMRREVA
jgi:hypothetical protein